ncbi:MAG TPA: DnaJ domain-containing protein [Terracidiphilus sp.]|nr:DnaJ domain-containing protein [Terracidiphilus sp.]
MLEMKTPDYYEFLQISANADSDTIHRVYRFLAARFHPDNTESGDPEKFFLLKSAYDVLSDPQRRAEYDASWERQVPEQPPLSTTIDFMDQMEGEMNRRLALLTVLYHRRRTCPYAPEVSLSEIETRMGFPREYLDFTTWYLVRKEYITRADNSDFTLTAHGVDFVEENRGSLPILNKLLTSGTEAATGVSAWKEETLDLPGVPGVVPPEVAHTPERRLNTKDRRKRSRDQRSIPTERRTVDELAA